MDTTQNDIQEPTPSCSSKESGGDTTPNSCDPPSPGSPPHNIIIKWSGKEFEIEDINGLKTVRDLKVVISSKTGVQADRQKILNLTFKGTPPN